jgi:NAD(P)-dependent dehydrogenase (short-subunit alcohol dehydrogenase family)
MERILITGANRGVGLELARQMTARGNQVFAGCRSPEKTAALETLVNQRPGQVTILPLDVTDEASIAHSASLIAAETDGLDILFNNAAIFNDGESIKTFETDAALQMLNANAVGQMLVVKHFVDLLKKGNQPKIINISSEAGSISQMAHYRGYYYYGSKAALNMFTRALAWDPETEGITVISVHPGWVRTDMGGPDAAISAEESAAGIRNVTDKLTIVDNGKFFTWEGIEYPW